MPEFRAGCGRAIVSEFKATVGAHWLAEMTNWNMKTLAVSFFLYLACIAPAITFGAIYEKTTHGWIGAVEMILATAWCGIVYALIGGQPMMINGGTGPVLAFSGVLYQLSETLDVPFLTFSAWVGLWTGVLLFIAALVDLNRYMHLATRFTDDIFSGLISTIFIVNALGSPTSDVGVFHYFSDGHKSHDDYRNANVTSVSPQRWLHDYSHRATALLSLACTLGTTYLALCLRGVKRSRYLAGPKMRAIVTDFGVVASVLTFTLVANLGFPDVETETLAAPDEFAPTFQCCTSSCRQQWPDDCPQLAAPHGSRPWLVDLWDLNGKGWVPFLAAPIALLAFILVFLDDGITWHLINRPENKLTHGAAYNYDTILIGIMLVVNSMLGLPWLVAATVRSINHVQAMAEKDPVTGKVVATQETRLTHLCIHLLCLVTIFALSLLKNIPVPVLYGVFLYMGIVSLGSNQFIERVTMRFMEPGNLPKRPYTSHVAPSTMFRFTAIQLGVFVLLYVVKTIKSIAIAFPLIIAACIPIRVRLLPELFAQEDLILIDGDEAEVDALLSQQAKGTKSAKVQALASSTTTLFEDQLEVGKTPSSSTLVLAKDSCKHAPPPCQV